MTLKHFPQILTGEEEATAASVGLINCGSCVSSFQGRSLAAAFVCHSPSDRRWCDILDFVPAGSGSSSLTLEVFKDVSHL